MSSNQILFRNLRKIIHTGNLLICANEILRRNVRILHVGAHAGQEKKLYDEYQLSEVYWVEPLPHLVKELKKIFPEKYVIPYAVWSERKTLKLQIANNEVSSSFYKFSPTNPFANQKTIKEIEVQTLTLNDIIEDYLPKDNTPVILVLDIQGSEYEALRGLSRKHTKNILGIVVEVSETPIYEGAATAEQLRKTLKQLGYRRILSLVRPPTNHGDELFLRKRELLRFNPLSRALTIRFLIKFSLLRFLLHEKKSSSATTN